jgi:hypothetical protein
LLEALALPGLSSRIGGNSFPPKTFEFPASLFVPSPDIAPEYSKTSLSRYLFLKRAAVHPGLLAHVEACAHDTAAGRCASLSYRKRHIPRMLDSRMLSEFRETHIKTGKQLLAPAIVF